MTRIWAPLGCALGALGVIVGAFGAHALKERLTPEDLAIYETGVQYHLLHAVMLVVAGVLARKGQRFAGAASAGFTVGIVVFSGSLYTLVLTGVRTWGAVTPIGGVAFIVAWTLLGAGLLARGRSAAEAS